MDGSQNSSGSLSTSADLQLELIEIVGVKQCYSYYYKAIKLFIALFIHLQLHPICLIKHSCLMPVRLASLMTTLKLFDCHVYTNFDQL